MSSLFFSEKVQIKEMSFTKLDVTLTTACYDLTPYYAKSRSLQENICNMKPLLEIPCYLVIYCDERTYPLIRDLRKAAFLEHMTEYKVHPFEKIDLFQFNSLVKQNRANYHPTKDERTCSESHLLCCNKFHFVLKTMEWNPFHTSKFGWIDANLQENCKKIATNYTNNMLLYVLKNVTDKFHIQILNVCDKRFKQPQNKKEFYQIYRWIVCGCLFTTGAAIGKKILTRLNELVVQTTKAGFGHAEEMFFLEVLDEFYEDIERSYGDYQHILNNFIKPTVAFNYILRNIINPYVHLRYYREGYECCQKVIGVMENYEVPISYDIYFSVLYSQYVCAFYYKKEEAHKIAKKMMQLIQQNPLIKKEFLKRKDFYESQLKFVQRPSDSQKQEFVRIETMDVDSMKKEKK